MFVFSPIQISNLIARDEQVFSLLYIKTVDIFSRFLKGNYRLGIGEQEDILADFYVRLRETLPQYKSLGSFESYLWTVFKNMIHDYFRRNKPLYFSEMSQESIDEGDVMNREETLYSEENIVEDLQHVYELEHITASLGKLDDITKHIIHLKCIEQYSSDHIGLLLGLSDDVVRQKLSRGLKKLKKLIAQDYQLPS